MDNTSCNHINYKLMEWGKIEDLNIKLYEAMMDDESEDVVKIINKLHHMLSEVRKDHKQ